MIQRNYPTPHTLAHQARVDTPLIAGFAGKCKAADKLGRIIREHLYSNV